MTRLLSLAGLAAAFSTTAAKAQENLEIIGVPVDKGTGFQPAVTELASVGWDPSDNKGMSNSLETSLLPRPNKPKN